MKLKELINNSFTKNEELEEIFEKYYNYTTMLSMFNTLEEAIEDLNDDEVTKKYEEILDLLIKKRIDCAEKEIKVD